MMGISGIGAAVTVVGDLVIETVLGDQDVDGQYRKMAQLNEQMKKQQEEMEFLRSTATVRAIRPRRLNLISSAVPTASPLIAFGHSILTIISTPRAIFSRV